ncbi:hypothetical protein, partial [Aquamicrobium sp.]|uniref:hypothetical protein n=1 Tax=Aquamicrobium sp. TaxID=1872579 RepID=UPI00258C7A5F
MEDRAVAAVGAALRDLALDAGEVRGLALALGFLCDRFIEGTKRLNALAGTRHAGVQGRIVRQVGEATPSIGERMGVMGRTAARHPAPRIGGIESVGHDDLRPELSAAGEKQTERARANISSPASLTMTAAGLVARTARVTIA